MSNKEGRQFLDLKIHNFNYWARMKLIWRYIFNYLDELTIEVTESRAWHTVLVLVQRTGNPVKRT